MSEEGARRTEGRKDGRKEGRADAGGMAANKTRTPHRDVGNNKKLVITILIKFLLLWPTNRLRFQR